MRKKGLMVAFMIMLGWAVTFGGGYYNGGYYRGFYYGYHPTVIYRCYPVAIAPAYGYPLYHYPSYSAGWWGFGYSSGYHHHHHHRHGYHHRRYRYGWW